MAEGKNAMLKELAKRNPNSHFEFKQIEDKVTEIIAEITGHRISDPKADLAALGLDSMALLDVLAAMEERFGVVLTEDVIPEFRTVHRIAHVIRDETRSSQRK